MRKFEISRKAVVEAKGNISLSRTKSTLTTEKAIKEANALLAEILSDLEVDV